MKKLFSFMLILAVMLSTSVVAYAEEYVPAYDEEIIAIPVGQNQTTSMPHNFLNLFSKTLRPTAIKPY